MEERPFMKYWVVGANGMLGQALVRELDGQEFLATRREEANLLDPDSLRQCANDFEPTVILNCAAYTAVDQAEDNEAEAFKVNVDGVRHLATVAKERDCRFINISTDYVFDGRAVDGLAGASRPL